MSKSPSVSQPFPVREFFARFPNEDACLVHLMNVRFGGTEMHCPECGVDCTRGRCEHRNSFVADVPVEEVRDQALDLLLSSG